MANKKNGSLSDKEVKNAAGGNVKHENGFYNVYDDETNKKVASYADNLDISLERANNFDLGYHEGKGRGKKIGLEKGYNAAKGVAGDGGQI